MENFPGRGILFFTIGSFLTLLLFEQHLAYAGILILSFGDAVSNLVGRHYGKIKTKLNPNKYIEGTFVGILVSIPIAYIFVPNIAAAIAASSIAMFLEMPNIHEATEAVHAPVIGNGIATKSISAKFPHASYFLKNLFRLL